VVVAVDCSCIGELTIVVYGRVAADIDIVDDIAVDTADIAVGSDFAVDIAVDIVDIAVGVKHVALAGCAFEAVERNGLHENAPLFQINLNLIIICQIF